MKIVKQTSGEIVLFQGRTTGIVTAGVLILTGGIILYFGYSSLAAIFASVMFLIVGLFGLVLTPALSININKTNRTIVSSSKSFLGIGKSTSYGINDVSKIEVRRIWRKINYGGEKIGWQYALMVQPVIVFKNDKELLIGREEPSSQFHRSTFLTDRIIDRPVAFQQLRFNTGMWFNPGAIGVPSEGGNGTLFPGEEDLTKMLKPVASFLEVPFLETDPGPNKWILDKR